MKVRVPAIELGLGPSADRISFLRERISKLTGRVTVSRDLKYLEERYTALKQAKADGKRTTSARPDPSAVVAASLTRARVQLLLRMCKEQRRGISAIMRDAFDAFARGNGYKVEIEHIKRIEETT